MNKTLKLTAALIGIAALTSCGEEYKPQDFTEPKKNSVIFSVTAKQGDEPVIWTEQSRIGIFCDALEQTNIPVTISASSSGTEEGLFIAPFEWGGNSEHTFSIYSPYSETSGSKINGTLPSSWSQSGQSQEHLASGAVLYGTISSLPLEKGKSLPVALSPIFRTFRIGINTADYISYNLDKVVISSTTGKPLSGTYTFDILTEELEITSQEQDPLSLSISGCTLGNGTASVYFLMKDGFTDECTFEVTVSDDEDNIIVLTGDATLAESTTLNIDEFESTAAIDESIDLSDPDGDGVKETANCYVAGIAGQTYRFPATVMGNGYTTPADPDYAPTVAGCAPGITPQPLNPASAQILWQTEKALITDVDLRKGYIYFTVNGQTGGTLTPGNAVIAAYSEADGGGYIVWSWHIWVTDADLDSKVQTWTVNKAYKDYPAYQNPQLMDRNLGALSVEDFATSGKNWSKGLNYQWGRKDPFIGMDNSSKNSVTPITTYDKAGNAIPLMAKTASDNFSSDKWVHVEKKISNADITKYPMSFVSGSANTFWIDTTEPPHDLWGCPGYSDESNNLGHKTIYDPCPPGYRVMNAYAMTGVTETPAGGKYANIQHNVLNTDYRTNGADIKIKCNDTEEIATLPASGMAPGYDFKNMPLWRSCDYGYIWSAKMTPDYSYKAYRMHFDYNNFMPKETAFVSYGHNVRCERIK